MELSLSHNFILLADMIKNKYDYLLKLLELSPISLNCLAPGGLMQETSDMVRKATFNLAIQTLMERFWDKEMSNY